MDEMNTLVGEWRMAAFPPDQPLQDGGIVTFEWLSEGSYLVQRWEVEYEHAPDGIAVIGPEDESGTKLCQHYFDTRGVARVYGMSLSGGVWKLWRDSPGFSQRFTGTFSEDGSIIEGAWEKSEDGANWEHDFDLVYTKVGDGTPGRDNVERVKRYIEEVWHGGDVTLLDEMFADDYRRHLSPADEPLDREGQRERIVGFRAAFPDIHFSVEDIVASGERVVFRAVLSGTHRGDFMGVAATGRRISVALMDMVRFDDSGRFAEQWGGPDLWDIRRQLTM